MDAGNGLLYELWHVIEDAGEEFTFCLAGPRGNSARQMLGAGAKMVWSVWARSYFEAMTLYYKRQGWGCYTTDQAEDFEPCSEEWVQEQRTFLAGL